MAVKPLHILSSILLLTLFSLASWFPVQADPMTCPLPLPVTIDIRPGSYPNAIKLSAQGLLPVAVLSTSDFNASQFSPQMAHLVDSASPMAGTCSGAEAVRWTWKDVNKDGQVDLVFFFKVEDLGFSPATTQATFMAHGTLLGDEVHLMGQDTVKAIP